MKHLFLIILIVATHALVAQRYAFQSYSTAQGLPQSQVTAICQDEEGYLWIGTLGGISRYNGNSFRNFSSENGLLNNRVNALSWFDDALWIGQDGGISVFSKKTIESYALSVDLKTTSVSRILKFRDNILVATNGGGLFVFRSKKLIPVKGPEGDYMYIRDVHVWEGKLYLATRGGMLRTADLKTFETFLPELPYSMSGIDDDGEQLLVSSFSKGLFFCNTRTGKWRSTDFSETDYRLENVLVDHTKTIWLSTQSSGVIKLMGSRKEFIGIDQGLPTGAMSALYEDREGNIWIGTLGKGIVKVPNGDLCYFDKSTGLASDLIISGFQTRSGSYYFGTFDAGVVKMDDFKKFETIPFQFNNTVWAAQSDVDGYHWFGTRASLVSMDANGNTKEYSIEDGTPGYKITSFYKLNSRSMYIGGNNGVVLYNNGQFIEVATNRKEIGTVRSLQVVENVLYVATDMGLYYLIGKRFELVQDFSKTVLNLVQHRDGGLYFGTEDGLFRLLNGKIDRIRFAPEVASNFIYFLNSKDELLIAGTNNGVFLLEGHDLVKERRVTRIGLMQGLVDLEANLNSSFFDNRNNLWFGTSSGLVRFNPMSYSKERRQVAIRLSEILLNYEPFDYTSYGAETNARDLPEGLVFPYNKNNLQFNLDGISLSQFSNLNFQYWLEGLEEGWSPPSKNTSVSFSGLPSGEYRLHARIVDIYGGREDELYITFRVTPPFYKTWWFITLVSLFVIGTVVLLFRTRLRREREKSENERVAFKARLVTLEQQSLNASMNRHFIFNSLNSIQYFINTSDKLSANKYLTNFAKLIRKNLDSSAEEDSMVSLAQEIERIELYLSLEAMRFKDRFMYTIDTHGVDTESYTIPAMMIQPFVENSIIHGVLPNTDRKGEIRVDVYMEGTHLFIKVQDNGIGIDESLSHKHDFGGDHRSQGMEITFKRIDLIRKVSDQKLELIGPRQLNGDDGSVNGTVVTLKIRIENLD